MRTIIMSVILAGLIAGSTLGQQSELRPGEWNYSLTPYLWMSGINGTIGIRDLEANVNADFGDLFQHFDGGFQLHYEATKDDWGYYVDPTYLKLSADGTTPRGEDAGLDFKEWLVEVAGVHRVAQTCDSNTGRTSSTYFLFGGRFWSLTSDLDIGGQDSKSGTQTWIDPFFGGRYTWSLSDLWTGAFRADIGGFGVGSSFTWNTSLYFGLKTAEKGSLWVGYRAMNVNRKSGSGDDFFKWDMTYSGPVLGYEFRF